MNRNVESHFSELPGIEVPRSIFDRSFTHKTTFDVGQLIPFYVDEVLPGDTFKVTTSKVVRLQTLLTPVMDNLYLDTYYFFCPNRILWDHWKEFAGENSAGAWYPTVSYQIPSISAPSSTGFNPGTIADYMGLPVGVTWTNSDSRRPSALPFRAYAKIAQEFFRDENLTDPLNIPTGDSNQTGTNGSSYINDVANGGAPFVVAKYHDYFSSCLPNPQKRSSPVEVPANLPYRPVITSGSLMYSPTATTVADSYSALFYTKDTNENAVGYVNLATLPDDLHSPYFPYVADKDIRPAKIGDYGLAPANLYVSGYTGLGININELRLAVQLQRYYERLARGGSRYTEFLKSFFGVTSPDASLQRPEYLGGNRVQVEIHEVTNTAQSQSDFLGDLGAMSVTRDVNEDFVHSFTEHGYVIGVCCLRYDHSYAQGLERFWSRRDFTDFYLPTFAHLGEQPVYKCEIYADSTTLGNNAVFGYQEAWGDYRYKQDRISGLMRPQVTGTLASWHFGDNYNQAPTLSDSWIREDKTNVDRTLAVTSSVSNQAFMDIYVKNICTRVMPMYSIPGLLDHF